MESVEAKQRTRAPLALAWATSLSRGIEPAKTMWRDLRVAEDLQVRVVVRRDGDEVAGERPGVSVARLLDVGRELVRRHVAGGQATERAEVAHERDQVRLADPGHGAAHDGQLGAQEGLAPGEEPVEAGGRADGGLTRSWHAPGRYAIADGRGPRETRTW